MRKISKMRGMGKFRNIIFVVVGLAVILYFIYVFFMREGFYVSNVFKQKKNQRDNNAKKAAADIADKKKAADDIAAADIAAKKKAADDIAAANICKYCSTYNRSADILKCISSCNYSTISNAAKYGTCQKHIIINMPFGADTKDCQPFRNRLSRFELETDY